MFFANVFHAKVINNQCELSRDPKKSGLLLGYLGLRTLHRNTPPHLHMSLTYVSGEKEMKEGDQGTRRAGEAKGKEKKTKDQAQKKIVVLKRKGKT